MDIAGVWLGLIDLLSLEFITNPSQRLQMLIVLHASLQVNEGNCANFSSC